MLAVLHIGYFRCVIIFPGGENYAYLIHKETESQ